MLNLVTENKIASAGAAAILTGVVLVLSASTVDTGPADNDDGSEIQLANIKKRKTLLALGGSILSIGILAQVYDQYTRFKSGTGFRSSSSSAQMSPAELSRFQDRVSAAAAKLRKSIADTSGNPGGELDLDWDGAESGESAAELAARASAQISSFIQNYS